MCDANRILQAHCALQTGSSVEEWQNNTTPHAEVLFEKAGTVDSTGPVCEATLQIYKEIV